MALSCVGVLAYHAVPGNYPSIEAFRYHVVNGWLRSLRRRSQRHRMPWDRFNDSSTALSPRPVCLASMARWPRVVLVAALGLWAIFNAVGLVTGLADAPVLELLFAGFGIAAVIAFCVGVTRAAPVATASNREGTRLGDVLGYLGRNSIVIYLAFTICMAMTRAVLLKAGPALLKPIGLTLDGDLVALVAATAGLLGALALQALVRNTRFAFLFVRPTLFHLGPTLFHFDKAAPAQPTPRPAATNVVPRNRVLPRVLRQQRLGQVENFS